MGGLTVGLIMARRGRGKNGWIINGRPLVEWALTLAQAVGLDAILVSTDDPGIFTATAALGAQAIRRPPELATDSTPDLPVVRHALETAYPDHGWRPDDVLVLLRPTAPFRTRQDIMTVVNLLRRSPEITSVRSVVPAPAHPRKCYRDAGFEQLPYRLLLPYTPQHAANHPRQYLEPVWQPVGFVDAVRIPWVFHGSLEGPVIAAWEAPPARAIDIDTEADLARAQRMAEVNGWTPGAVA